MAGGDDTSAHGGSATPTGHGRKVGSSSQQAVDAYLNPMTQHNVNSYGIPARDPDTTRARLAAITWTRATPTVGKDAVLGAGPGEIRDNGGKRTLSTGKASAYTNRDEA